MTPRILSLLIAAVIAVAATAALAAGPSYRLEVAGLACPFCAYGIEKQLGQIEGVQRIETHIKDGAVIVTMQEGGSLDKARAEQAVENAGFTLRGFEPIDTAHSGGSQ